MELSSWGMARLEGVHHGFDGHIGVYERQKGVRQDILRLWQLDGTNPWFFVLLKRYLVEKANSFCRSLQLGRVGRVEFGWLEGKRPHFVPPSWHYVQVEDAFKKWQNCGSHQCIDCNLAFLFIIIVRHDLSIGAEETSWGHVLGERLTWIPGGYWAVHVIFKYGSRKLSDGALDEVLFRGDSTLLRLRCLAVVQSNSRVKNPSKTSGEGPKQTFIFHSKPDFWDPPK